MGKNRQNSGQRKNILSLWNTDVEKFELGENILNLNEIIEYYSRDLYLREELQEVHSEVIKIVESLGIYDRKEDDAIQIKYLAENVINLELLIYMLMKSSGSNEFVFENIRCLLSNILEVIPESYDKEILYKTRTLFKNVFGMNLYRETLIFYKEFFQNNMRVFNVLDGKVCANKSREDDGVNDVEYTSFVLNKRNGLISSRIDLYEKIIQEDSVYDYVLNFYPFPTTLNYDGKVDRNNRLIGRDEGKKIVISTPNYASFTSDEARKIERVLPGGALKAKHLFSFYSFLKNRINAKSRVNIDEIKFDLVAVARELDGLLGTHSWVDRVANIRFKEIRFGNNSIPELPFEANTLISLKEASHIVGMLGVGKSTFTTLLTYFCQKNNLYVTHITKDKKATVETYSSLYKVGVGANESMRNIGIFRGNSDTESFLIELLSKVTDTEGDILEVIRAQKELYRCFDDTSIVKEKVKKFIYDNTDDDHPEVSDEYKTIVLTNGKDKGKRYANPEYLVTDKYYWIEKLMKSKIWIGNIDSLLVTNMPYQYDFLCRDLYTIVHLASDVIIEDEIDELHIKSDDRFIITEKLVSNLAATSDKVMNDMLEKNLPKANKHQYYTEFSKGMLSVCKQQENIVSNMFAMLDDFYISKRLKSSFSLQSKIKDFMNRYFELLDEEGNKVNIKNLSLEEPRKIFYGVLNSLKISDARDFKTNYETDETVFDMAEIILKTESYLNKFNRSSYTYILSNKQFVNDFDKKYPNICFGVSKDVYCNEHKLKRLSYKLAIDIANQYGLKIRTENIFNRVPDENENDDKILSNIYFKDVCFLILLSRFDSKQNMIMQDSYAFGQEMNIESLKNTTRSMKISSLYPSPLIERNLFYRVKSSRGIRKNEQGTYIEIMEYGTVGRKVLLESRDIIKYAYKDVRMPIVVMLSATSYMSEATKYHVDVNPSAMLMREIDNMRITMGLKFVESEGELLTVSGAGSTQKKVERMTEIFKSLESSGFINDLLKKMQFKYSETQKLEDVKERFHKRQIIAIPVPSFELAYGLGESLHRVLKNKNIVYQYKKGLTYCGEKTVVVPERQVLRDSVDRLYEKNVDIFVFVMGSIGRGFNILQSDRSYHSLIGTMLFPVRPYLHPEDSSWHIHMLHSKIKNSVGKIMRETNYNYENYDFNKNPHIVFNKLTAMNTSLLNDLSCSEIFWDDMAIDVKRSMVANFLVEILQVMGRGLRGGTDLDVFLLDASFVSKETRASILEKGMENYVKGESEGDSFLSVAETILCRNHIGDEVFYTINGPLIRAFENKVLKSNNLLNFGGKNELS